MHVGFGGFGLRLVTINLFIVTHTNHFLERFGTCVQCWYLIGDLCDKD